MQSGYMPWNFLLTIAQLFPYKNFSLMDITFPFAKGMVSLLDVSMIYTKWFNFVVEKDDNIAALPVYAETYLWN